MPTLKGYHDQTESISGNGGKWVMDKNAVIFTAGNGYFEDFDAHDNDLLVKGTIVVGTSNFTSTSSATGVVMQGDNAEIVIAKSAYVEGENGVIAYGADSSITNAGTIVARSRLGIEFYSFGDAGSIVNTGTVSGDEAIFTYGSGVSITNGKSGQILGRDHGVHMLSTGEGTHLTNAGIIAVSEGGGYAILGGENDDKVVNTGEIHGRIDLGDGDDTFDFRGGKLDDVVAGGEGNDTLITKKTGVILSEQADDGYDTVKSAVSYALGDNIEVLTLTGKKAIDGTGNGENNHITGNAGKNKLVGGAGEDWLIGGKGTDTLTGDDGLDTFVLRKGFGKDTVTDFTDGDDRLSVIGKGFNGPEDVAGRVSQHGDDTWVTLSRKDILILKDIDSTLITSGDFVFVM